MTETARIKPSDTWECECGKVHGIGMYAAAHWHETLVHTCPCGRKHTLLAGFVTLDEEEVSDD